MEFIQVIPVLLFSVVVHEVAHAWVARREGDDTAERLGRITLNPIPHLDLWGSLIVPLFLVASGTGFIFGWAKPVPVNPAKYRNLVWGDIRVSLAGIVSNLILVVLFGVAAILLFKFEAATQMAWVGALGGAALWGIIINLLLACFNLLPIPPLDGSHVVAHALPESLAGPYRASGRYGLLILMGLLYFGGDFSAQYLFGPFRELSDAVLQFVMQRV